MKFSLVRWFRRLRRAYILIKEQERAEQVTNLYFLIKPCVYCQRPITIDCVFCPQCGTSQDRQTSEQYKLVKPARDARTKKLDITEQLKKAPHWERPLDTFNRVMRKKE